jgi:hypothetical protein
MRFLGASLKGREVEMMINNPQAATKDLNIFYKQFNSNWKCDNPLDVISVVN